jgi:hypothetical protein
LQEVSLVAEDPHYTVEVVGATDWKLDGQTKLEGRFFIVKDKENIQAPQENITLLLLQDGKVIDKIKTSFMGPMSSRGGQ